MDTNLSLLLLASLKRVKRTVEFSHSKVQQ